MITPYGDGLIFLLSLPRSGSTVLSLLLGAHSAVCCPPEPWFLLRLWSLTAISASDTLYDDELARLGARAFLRDEDLQAAGRAFAVSAYNAHLQRLGKHLFVDKTPRYHQILPFLDQLFPQARKIWLIRNPLNVAASYQATWGIDIEELTDSQPTPVSCDFALGLFALADYFAERAPEKHCLHYESLTRYPRDELTRLCKFLGIPFEDRMLAYSSDTGLISEHTASIMGDRAAVASRGVHDRRLDTWRTSFSTAMVQRLIDRIGFQIFRRLGYLHALDELQTRGVRPPDEEEASTLRGRFASVPRYGVELARLQAALDASETTRRASVEEISGLHQQLRAVQAERVRQDAVIDGQERILQRLPVRLLRHLRVV